MDNVEKKPVDCSGTPASCPDNEGYGRACPSAAAPQVAAKLPKWIDDRKGSDPLVDDLIAYIEQIAAPQVVADERYSSCLATIRDLDRISMKFAADLTGLPVVEGSRMRNVDYLARYSVLELVAAWLPGLSSPRWCTHHRPASSCGERGMVQGGKYGCAT